MSLRVGRDHVVDGGGGNLSGACGCPALPVAGDGQREIERAQGAENEAHLRACLPVFDREQPWPGATFTASAEEAALLTGRPRREFDGLRTRRVWTRRRARAGRVPHDADLFLGQAPDG